MKSIGIIVALAVVMLQVKAQQAVPFAQRAAEFATGDAKLKSATGAARGARAETMALIDRLIASCPTR